MGSDSTSFEGAPLIVPPREKLSRAAQSVNREYGLAVSIGGGDGPNCYSPFKALWVFC